MTRFLLKQKCGGAYVTQDDKIFA